MNRNIRLQNELTDLHKIKFAEVANSFIPNYIFDTENATNYSNLLKYFLGIDGALSLEKGIWLYGNYGVGKSMLMYIVRAFLIKYFPNSRNGFYDTSIERIIREYKKFGNIDKYFGDTFEQGNEYGKIRHLLINEFGKTIDEKIYGTEAQQIINNLIMIRYDLFQNQGLLTHVTSNTLPYSDKAALSDRYVEMFNIVHIKGTSKRK